MSKGLKNLYIRCIQKDYSLEFKLSVVREIERSSIGITAARRKYGIQGHGTIREWRRKYGTFDRNYQINAPMSKTPQQKIFELEQKVRLLEKEKSFLEQEMMNTSDKANILDQLVELAEQEYNICIRKNSCPGQSKLTTKNTKKR